jgi:hypothetical protein
MVFDFRTIVGALGGDPEAFGDVDVANLVTDAAGGTRY